MARFVRRTPLVYPSNSSDNTAIWIGVVMAVLVISIVGWYYSENHKTQQTTKEPESRSSRSSKKLSTAELEQKLREYAQTPKDKLQLNPLAGAYLYFNLLDRTLHDEEESIGFYLQEFEGSTGNRRLILERKLLGSYNTISDIEEKYKAIIENIQQRIEEYQWAQDITDEFLKKSEFEENGREVREYWLCLKDEGRFLKEEVVRIAKDLKPKIEKHLGSEALKLAESVKQETIKQKELAQEKAVEDREYEKKRLAKLIFEKLGKLHLTEKVKKKWDEGALTDEQKLQIEENIKAYMAEIEDIKKEYQDKFGEPFKEGDGN